MTPRSRPAWPAALAVALLLALPATALAAGPPIVTTTSSTVTGETSAELTATVDPNSSKTTAYHFEYVGQAAFERDGFATATSTPDGPSIAAGAGPTAIEASVEGLAPGAGYHLRVLAKNGQGTTTGEERIFTTLTPPQAFGPCPNEPLRSGPLAPAGAPSALLPDCRAYEQATPTEKDGNDALGAPGLVRAADRGGAITFLSTSGIPGGEGAQELPVYLASREGGAWSTVGLLPPASAGSRAVVLGWTPDLSLSFAQATLIGEPVRKALFVRRHPGPAPARRITPYLPMGGGEDFAYVGASADEGTILFEAPVRLPAEEGAEPLPGSLQGQSNLYAYDARTGRFSLASAMNTEEETARDLPKGAEAGRYGHFGALQDPRAVSAGGSVVFTAKGSGHLYQRLNPTMPQSAVIHEGEPTEECTEPAKACTLDISATRREPADPAGPREAAFAAASADGKTVFLTSSEELTGDAHTGPVEPPARIGTADLEAEDPQDTVDESLIPANALGLAASPDGRWLYWADPVTGTIGRADLTAPDPGEAVEERFIEPGEATGEYEPNPIEEPGVSEPITGPTIPRYVAVDGDHVYWTNTGTPSGFGFPIDRTGTIGRAAVDPATGALVPGSVEPAFIKGASNPQGIAVNATHIYWANAGREGPTEAIGRAALGGGAVEQDFYRVQGSRVPYGVATSPGKVCFAGNEEVNDNGYVTCVPLEGGEEKALGAGRAGRGLATDAGHIYWADQEEGTIGRASLAQKFETGELLTPEGTLTGLAVSGGRLYWSVNGETPPHPGNDLYRRQAQGTGGCIEAGGCLTDLTPDPTDANGAEVVGVLGASADGSYVYFTANADLDGGGPAEAGDCRGPVGSTTGSCSLYAWHDGTVGFIARLDADGSEYTSDSTDWLLNVASFSAGSYNERTSFISADGGTLLFRSHAQQTGYRDEGAPEFYLYRAGHPGLTCVTCDPTGNAPPGEGPRLFSYEMPGLSTRAESITSAHTLSADGGRVFFDTTEALVGADTDGGEGCPDVGAGPQEYLQSCRDVYEWEAPGEGSCTTSASSYSHQDEGCIYLISPGGDGRPSLFADASADGGEVFFLTRTPLVGQDKDALFDLYDARVDGGQPGQNPPPASPCEGEACKGAAAPAPAFAAPPAFRGPGNPRPKPKGCPKGKVKKGGRCVKRRPANHGNHGNRHHAKHARRAAR